MVWSKKKHRRKSKHGRKKIPRVRRRLLIPSLFLVALYGLLKVSVIAFGKLKIFMSTKEGYWTIVGLGLGMAFLFGLFLIRKIKKWFLKKAQLQSQRQRAEINQRHRELKLTELLPSVDRGDYLISKSDYRRGNSKENYYRKTFLLRLLEAFENGCAKCGTQKELMNLDHFFFSKNEGGCFVMKHKLGHLVNNAIPLCSHCNRSKSDKDFQLFFSSKELLGILSKNQKMTILLNEELILDPMDRPRRKNWAS